MWHMRWMMGHRRGLRVLILSILGAGAKNGVQIMDEIESATHGRWRPSPGSVYPAIERLTAEGLIRRDAEGKYELTQRARDEIDFSFGPWGRRTLSVEEILQEISSYLSYFEDLRRTAPDTLRRQLAKIRALGNRMSKIGEE